MEVGDADEPALDPPVRGEPEPLAPPSEEEPLDEELLPGVADEEPGVDEPVREDEEEGLEDEDVGEVDMLNSWVVPKPL